VEKKQSMQPWRYNGRVIGRLLAACVSFRQAFKAPGNSSSSTPGFCFCIRDPGRTLHYLCIKNLCIDHWQVADKIAWGSWDSWISTWLDTSNIQQEGVRSIRTCNA
jgi:hypothetical protein